MPAKTNLAALNCSLARAMNLIGDWWTLLILRDAFFGACRFGEFQKSLGIARNILAKRLDRLVCEGLLRREGTENRPRYRLTAKGQALAPALVALLQWGDAWASDGIAPVVVTDPEGKPVETVTLSTPQGPVDPIDIRFAPGPGATPRTRAFMALLSEREDGLAPI